MDHLIAVYSRLHMQPYYTGNATPLHTIPGFEYKSKEKALQRGQAIHFPLYINLLQPIDGRIPDSKLPFA
jgi:hypothetical protein